MNPGDAADKKRRGLNDLQQPLQQLALEPQLRMQ